MKLPGYQDIVANQIPCRATRRRFIGLSSVLASALVPSVPAFLGGCATRSDESFTSLFNGRNLSGWTPVNVAPNTFTVRDEMIVSTGIPTGVMRTNRQYENFIVELEWRHMKPGGNAGFFVYSDPIPAVGVPFTRSIEIQVLDGDSTDGTWTGHGDVFAIHGARMTPDRPHPKGWERCLPSERRAHPAGQWNHYQIESRNGRLTLAVNGKVVSGGSNCSPRRGYICLESEGSECHFRNLRIREFPGSHPPPAEIAPLDTGLKSLYTGLNLDGWKSVSAQQYWLAKDWNLVGDGNGPSELWSVFNARDFEFQCDWRLAKPGSSAAIVFGARPRDELRLRYSDGEWKRVSATVRRGEVLGRAEQVELMLQGWNGTAPGGSSIGLCQRDGPVEFANIFAKPLGA